jgi:hypothetical protein
MNGLCSFQTLSHGGTLVRNFFGSGHTSVHIRAHPPAYSQMSAVIRLLDQLLQPQFNEHWSWKLELELEYRR